MKYQTTGAAERAGTVLYALYKRVQKLKRGPNPELIGLHVTVAMINDAGYVSFKKKTLHSNFIFFCAGKLSNGPSSAFLINFRCASEVRLRFIVARLFWGGAGTVLKRVF